jgi:hypothetical protein
LRIFGSSWDEFGITTGGQDPSAYIDRVVYLYHIFSLIFQTFKSASAVVKQPNHGFLSTRKEDEQPLGEDGSQYLKICYNFSV